MKKPRVVGIGTAVTMLLCVNVAMAQWTTAWQAGAPGRAWPTDGVGGGPDVDFVQEAGTNPPPGDPNSPAVDQQADDDYYFAGTYPDPPSGVGVVASDEIAFERALSGNDNDLRIHFNLPDNLNADDRFRFSFEANRLNEGDDIPNPRYGVEVLFNSTLIMPEIILSPAELDTIFTTLEFTAADVGAMGGAGADNIVALHGISYSADGGGTFVGMDYHALEIMRVPEPGSFGMLLAGMICAIPIMLCERGKRRMS